MRAAIWTISLSVGYALLGVVATDVAVVLVPVYVVLVAVVPTWQVAHDLLYPKRYQRQETRHE